MALYIVMLTYLDDRVEDKRFWSQWKQEFHLLVTATSYAVPKRLHLDLQENQQHGHFTRPRCKLAADKSRYSEGNPNRGGKETLLIVFLVVWQRPTFQTTHSTFARKVAQVKKKRGGGGNKDKNWKQTIASIQYLQELGNVGYVSFSVYSYSR